MLCNINELCIGNTYFDHKLVHKKTWRSPDRNTNNEIDYICISRRWKSSLKDVSVCRGVDVGSDHHLMVGKIQLKLKKILKPKSVKPFAMEKLKKENHRKRFQLTLNNKFAPLLEVNDFEEQWKIFKEGVVSAAEEELGRRKGKRKERWIQERTWQLVDERRKEIKGRTTTS